MKNLKKMNYEEKREYLGDLVVNGLISDDKFDDLLDVDLFQYEGQETDEVYDWHGREIDL